jgi:hypothetical protein
MKENFPFMREHLELGFQIRFQTLGKLRLSKHTYLMQNAFSLTYISMISSEHAIILDAQGYQADGAFPRIKMIAAWTRTDFSAFIIPGKLHRFSPCPQPISMSI